MIRKSVDKVESSSKKRVKFASNLVEQRTFPSDPKERKNTGYYGNLLKAMKGESLDFDENDDDPRIICLQFLWDDENTISK